MRFYIEWNMENMVFFCPLPKNSQCLVLTFDGHSVIFFIKGATQHENYFPECLSTITAVILHEKNLAFTVTEFPLPSYSSVTLHTVRSFCNSSQLTPAPPAGFITSVWPTFSLCRTIQTLGLMPVGFHWWLPSTVKLDHLVPSASQLLSCG